MDVDQKSLSRCIYQNKELLRILSVALVLFNAGLLFRGIFVNGQVLKPVEANSSPSSVITVIGSSVWLHWNYTYLGDGNHISVTSKYNEQVIRFNDTSNSNMQIVAKRNGQNGALTLKSPVPAPFNGRVEVISSNNTLVIHRLQYNDSLYQFGSIVNVAIDLGGGFSNTSSVLKPTVSITINGIPNFIALPPSTLDVNENSNLILRIDMDGNPHPSADFQWPHLPSSPATNVPSVNLYPFVYSSTYSLTNIAASYCGRILQTTIKNSIGSSAVQSTNVTVLLKLDKDFGLKSGKLGGDNCIEVTWNKAESGACFVMYDVTFTNTSGHNLHTQTGYNIGGMNICNLTVHANITNVQLVVSFKSTSKTIAAEVLRTPITTPPPTTKATASKSGTRDYTTQTSSIGITSTVNPQVCKECKISSCDEWNTRDSAYIAVIAVLVIIIIISLIFNIKQWRKSNPETKHAETGTKSQPDVMHYMDLQTRSNENELNYAKLQGDYEEIGQKNPHYVNA